MSFQLLLLLVAVICLCHFFFYMFRTQEADKDSEFRTVLKFKIVFHNQGQHPQVQGHSFNVFSDFYFFPFHIPMKRDG